MTGMTRCVILTFVEEMRKPSAEHRIALAGCCDSFASNLPKLLAIGDDKFAAVFSLIDAIYPDLFAELNGKVAESADRIAYDIAMIYAFATVVSIA